MKRNIIIGLIVLTLALIALVIQQQNATKKQIFTDPATGNQVVRTNIDTQPEKDVNPTKKIVLNVDDTIFDKGLTADEFQAMLRAFDEAVKQQYGDDYRYGAVQSKTVSYNKAQDTYRFHVRLGEPATNNPILPVTIKRIRYNVVQVTVKDTAGQTIIDKQEKVHLVL